MTSPTFTVVIRDDEAKRPTIFRGKYASIRGRLTTFFSQRQMLPWTPEREEFLRKNYRRISAAKIAALFAHESSRPFTRNAVISRARKLGLGKGGAA